MKARGFQTALGVALAGASIGLAAPVNAAPEGPDSIETTVSDAPATGYAVIVDQFDLTPLDRTKVIGVPPGLEPRQLAGPVFFGVG